MKPMQVLVDGLLTAYETNGAGKAVVLLHGWGDQAAGLRGLQRALAKHFLVIAPDLPGFGGTQAPANVWGLDEYAAFLGHFLEKVGASPYAIVGHSNGGAIAIRGLANRDITAERLVLLASAGIRGQHRGRVQTLKYITKTGKLLTLALPASVKRSIRQRVYRAAGSDLLVAEHLQETFKKVVADDVRADAAKLTLPTLLVYGQNDPATPVRYGELLHELIPKSALTVLPDAGHFVHLDRPDEVVRTIEEFL